MNNTTKQITNDFIENRDIIKKTLKFESQYIIPVAANEFCAAGVKADAEKLSECKKIIKKNSGFASYLKGNILPDDFMERITEIFMYQMEKKSKGKLRWKIVHRILNKIV